jgi:acyl carrier protein phosphodiesterase
MNHLAHLFLSFGDPKIMVGNFIADSVKGKQFLSFAPEIQHGIILHKVGSVSEAATANIRA